MACDFVPPLVEQLHGADPTAGSDCAICCAKMAIRFASCGALDPSPDKIRAQAGLDEPNPPPDDFSTTMSEYCKAVNAFDDEARGKGYDGIPTDKHEQDPRGTLEDTLKAEKKWVTVFVDYGVVQDREPSKTGDKGFHGSHAVSVFGYKSGSETDDGSVKFRIYDPLCDGRRDEIPKGPTWWKASTLRDAADAYAGGGSGNATWTTTARSTVLPDSDPQQAPADPEQMTAELAGEARTRLYELSEAARVMAAELADYLGGNPDAVSMVVRSGVTPPDAAD